MTAKQLIRVQGACLTDPAGPGGYAAAIETPKGVLNLTGSHPGTNSERMAMAGAIEALRTLNSMSDPDAAAIIFTSDDTLAWALSTGAARNWDTTGWQFPDGTDVTNQDLWYHLLEAAGNRPLESVLHEEQQDLLKVALERARTARSVGRPAHSAANALLQPA